MAREWVGIQVACQKVEQLIFSIKSILNLIPFECVYRCYPPDWLHLLIIVCRRFHVRYLDPDLSTLLSEESPATNKKFQRLNDSIASLVSNSFSTSQHALKLLYAGNVIASCQLPKQYCQLNGYSKNFLHYFIYLIDIWYWDGHIWSRPITIIGKTTTVTSLKLLFLKLL